MKKETIVCDGCGALCESGPNLHWEYRPTVFTLDFPRDSVNGGKWNMDVCPSCRYALFDGITAIVTKLRQGESDKPAMTDNHLMPYCHENGFSTVRNMVVAVMQTVGANDHDFRLRDKCIFAANPWLVADREALVANMERQLYEARSLIETSLGLEYRDGGYYPLDDCNHDDDVEAMEALRKETEIGRQ